MRLGVAGGEHQSRSKNVVCSVAVAVSARGSACAGCFRRRVGRAAGGRPTRGRGSGSGRNSGWWPPRSRWASRCASARSSSTSGFHRQRVGEEAGAWGAVGDPEVDGPVDRELDDVVGREAQPFLFVLVDGDAVGVDLHRQAGERAGVLHLAHAEDRDRLQQRADAGADDLVADLRGVLPGEDGLEAGGAALGEHLRHRWGEDVVGLVDQQRHAAAVGLGELLARLDGAVQELQQQLGDEDRVVLADGGLGAGDDQDLAALEDPVEVDRVRGGAGACRSRGWR